MNWIAIKDQKPNDWQDVIVALSSGSVVIGMRGPMGWDWANTDNPADFEAVATHWMPFPKHPEAA